MNLQVLSKLLLLTVLCSCDLSFTKEGSGPPSGKDKTHELSSAECDVMGRRWIPSTQFAAGGYCENIDVPSSFIPVPILDAGVNDSSHD